MLTLRHRFPLLTAVCMWAVISVPVTHAVPMVSDPKGFSGITWGTSLNDRPELALVTTANRIKEYDRKSSPLQFGDAAVDTMRFSSVDGKFARVTIRYKGKDTLAKVLVHLQLLYGPLDRTPGQMMRSANQQYNWRGTDTEVNMTFDGMGERGFLFIESTVLAPRFNDSLTDSAY